MTNVLLVSHRWLRSVAPTDQTEDTRRVRTYACTANMYSARSWADPNSSSAIELATTGLEGHQGSPKCVPNAASPLKSTWSWQVEKPHAVDPASFLTFPTSTAKGAGKGSAVSIETSALIARRPADDHRPSTSASSAPRRSEQLRQADEFSVAFVATANLMASPQSRQRCGLLWTSSAWSTSKS